MLKRLLVSLIALGMLVTCYGAYVYVFGHFSLQPLPEKLLPTEPGEAWVTTPTSNHAKQMARRVWGDGAWQAGDDVVTLYWLKSGVIVYIKDYEKESPDTWRLVPFALIYTESAKNQGTEPQIVTMEGQEATLIFDHPVDLIRMSGARPIGGKISGNVQIQADRGTENPLDDLVAYADELQFKEEERRVWTDSPVRMVSADAVITGMAGEMHLNFSEPARSGTDAPRFESVSDLILFRDVQVNMLAVNNGVAPGAGKTGAAPKSKNDNPAKDETKTPVQITCQGPFRYDLESSEAQFNRNVTMIRQTGDAQYDRLFSDELVVYFEKASRDDNVTADPKRLQKPGSMQFEFRQARATGRAVRVLSDSQSIEAIGQEMVYDAATGNTILRGDPDVVATKEGNVLHGQKLKFTGGEPGHQIAEAVGEGSLEARDADGELTLTARWTEGARIAPHGELGKNQLLILQGAAEVDQPGRGSFNADRLKVWLQPAVNSPTKLAGQGTDPSRWAPSRVEGVGHVLAKSDTFVLQAANRLDMVFEDVPADARIDTTPTVDSGMSIGPKADKTGSGARGRKPASSVAAPAGAAESGNTAKARPPKPPSHLSADLIKIKALRAGDRTDVSEVETEGHVDFEQAPAEADGDSVVVRGDALSLKRVEEKYYLQVTGRPAHVELNTMKVDGDRVNIDQPTGTAWVDGKGLMILTSETSFEGKKLDAPTELTIAWGTRMFFDGLMAEFGGGVEAQQGNSHLHCQSLIAKLTEQMDISAPRKQGSAAAKIKELECKNAVVLENTEAPNGRLEKYDHLEAIELIFSNQSGQMSAKGPGVFRTCTRGDSDFAPPQQRTPAAKTVSAKSLPKESDQLFLTDVHFADRLEGDQIQQIAKFFGHVEAIRSPVADQNQSVNPDKLGPNGMRIACATLEMATKRGPDDRPYNVMVATDNVSVEADVFTGRADRVSYNQLYDRIIFESRGNTPAMFYRQPRRGEKRDETTATKIYYNVRTTEVNVDGAWMLELQERETDRKGTNKPDPKRR